MREVFAAASRRGFYLEVGRLAARDALRERPTTLPRIFRLSRH